MTVFYGELGDTFTLAAAVNDTSGSAVDGTTPLFDVRKGGATISDAPILSGTPGLISHANYGPGLYEISVAATSGNGFADATTYHVFITVTADSQTPGAYVGSIVLGQLQTAADLGLLLETTIATLASQTSFTLTVSSAINDTYNNLIMVIEDAGAVTSRDLVWASDYVGSSKTVTLNAGTTTFTAATGDKVRVFAAFHPLAPIYQVVDLRQIRGTILTGDGSGTPFNV